MRFTLHLVQRRFEVLRLVLAAQFALMTICALAALQLIVHFPFPSPLIRPILPPKQAWPPDQIMQWVELGNYDSNFLEYFARDPARHIPKGTNLVSPADGVVQRALFDNEITYLVVGMSFWDVHVVRALIAGIVKNIEDDGSYYPRGVWLKHGFLKGKPSPVEKTVTIETKYGDVKVRLVSSYWASRLKVWVRIGERIEKGDKIGRILLGSTVITELPGDVPLIVKPKERVVGGETIISNQGEPP